VVADVAPDAAAAIDSAVAPARDTITPRSEHWWYRDRGFRLPRRRNGGS
jgi:hypothetical protein